MSENYVPKSDAELQAQDYQEVSHWRDENGELLDEDGRREAAVGLQAARDHLREQLLDESPDEDERWEDEGGQPFDKESHHRAVAWKHELHEQEADREVRRWETEGGHLLTRDIQPKSVQEPNDSTELYSRPRVRRNRTIEKRMTEIAEQLLGEGEKDV